jgi:hypothetical protein
MNTWRAARQHPCGKETPMAIARPLSVWFPWPCFALLAAALAPSPSSAAGPVPPCGGEVVPAYAEPGPLPVVRVWRPGELPASWTPPACTGWTARPDVRVTATAGQFRAASLDELLRRVGAISGQETIRSWSSRQAAWRPLLDSAAALRAPDPGTIRADFASAELASGAELYVLFDEAGPLGPIVHAFTVRERTPGRIVLASRNLTPGRARGLEIAAPGELELIVFLDRAEGDRWRYYALSRIDLHIPRPFRPPEADFVHRAIAMFRYVAGLPTDSMPVAAAK